MGSQCEMQPPGLFQFEPGEPNIDGLMRWQAKHYANDTILAYPNTQGDYDTNLTGDQMERITAYTASRYAEAFSSLPAGEVTGTPGFGGLDTRLVGMVNASTLGQHMTYVALHRLGFSPLLISPRLAEAGYAHLFRVTGCRCVVAGGSALAMMRTVKKGYEGELDVVPMLDDDEVLEALERPRVQLAPPSGSPGHIIHTGGTTGLPKPVAMYMHDWMARLPLSWEAQKETVLCTLPIFHSYGIGTYIRSMRTATPLYLLNAFRPVTASIIWRALDATNARHLYTVPYVLKFFADVEGGIQRLSKLKTVRPGGSALPEDLGDELVRNGIVLSMVYGQTEAGCPMVQYGTSVDDWKWLTPLPFAEKFMKFEKVGDNMYHLIFLPGLEGLKISDNPDGSYSSKDLFQPHPDNLPGTDVRPGKARWKFLARQGDIIVLVNGENADPTPIEHAVMLDPLVQMAAAFGAGHERPGLLLIPSEKARGLSDEELIRRVKPALDRGNKLAADYARISTEDIIVKPIGTEYPQTAKMTLQRPVLNKLFADDIEAHYASREVANGKTVLSDQEVRAVVRRVVEHEFKDRAASSQVEGENGQPALDDNDDFFALGMDSLQSSLVRRRLLREIPLPAAVNLATNVVFEYPTVELLSEHILQLRQQKPASNDTASRDPETLAQAMVEKYVKIVTAEPSTSPSSAARQNGHHGHVIVLTGATGYIGAQLLNILLRRPDVSTVYCLVRTRQTGDHESADERIRTALRNSALLDDLAGEHLSKLRSLSSNLAAADLGLTPSEYAEVSASVTAVIHNAWSVNFNMGLASFEPNVASVAHLLNLTKADAGSSPRPRSFMFISSVASVGGAGRDASGKGGAQERLYGWRDAKPFNGYGQSKWVAEQICEAAATSSWAARLGISVRALRIGQVSGDTRHGIWNPAEAIPAMVQSALTVGALPEMQDEERNSLRWLPSDVTAAVITDLTLVELDRQRKDGGQDLAVFHVASPHTLTWNQDVLPAVEQAGIAFRAVPQREWVRILSEGDKSIETNPPYKLIEHFRQTYGRDRGEEANGDDANSKSGEGGVLVHLDLTRSLQYSSNLKSASPVDRDLLVRYVHFWSAHWAKKEQSVTP